MEPYTYTVRLVVGGSLLVRSDGAIIPDDLDNTDYQTYLDWVEQGNKPEVVGNETLPTTLNSTRKWSEMSAALYSSSLYQNHLRLATRSAPSQIADRLWWIDKDLTTVLVNWVSSEELRVKALTGHLQDLIGALAESGFPITEEHKTEIVKALSGNGFDDIAQSFQ
jgi:hypothetical protein